ncbi:unnamed protein product [Musa acuminata subsp. burmannicoides]
MKDLQNIIPFGLQSPSSVGVAHERRRVVGTPKIHRRRGRCRRSGVPGGESPSNAVAVGVAAQPFVEVEGITEGVVSEPAVPGPAAEPPDEGLPSGAGHDLRPLPHFHDHLHSSPPPPPPRHGPSPVLAPLHRLARPRARPGHPEAATAALGEHLVRGD